MRERGAECVARRLPARAPGTWAGGDGEAPRGAPAPPPMRGGEEFAGGPACVACPAPAPPSWWAPSAGEAVSPQPPMGVAAEPAGSPRTPGVSPCTMLVPPHPPMEGDVKSAGGPAGAACHLPGPSSRRKPPSELVVAATAGASCFPAGPPGAVSRRPCQAVAPPDRAASAWTLEPVGSPCTPEVPPCPTVA